MGCVGPFFYIDNHIVFLKITVSDGEVSGDFINHPTSHYQFSLMLGLDDYGHYPRGRVIYNKKRKIYYIYINKSLVNNVEEIKEIYVSISV